MLTHLEIAAALLSLFVLMLNIELLYWLQGK